MYKVSRVRREWLGDPNKTTSGWHNSSSAPLTLIFIYIVRHVYEAKQLPYDNYDIGGLT